jgi:uncharacterized protein (DUF934 family)
LLLQERNEIVHLMVWLVLTNIRSAQAAIGVALDADEESQAPHRFCPGFFLLPIRHFRGYSYSGLAAP